MNVLWGGGEHCDAKKESILVIFHLFWKEVKGFVEWYWWRYRSRRHCSCSQWALFAFNDIITPKVMIDYLWFRHLLRNAWLAGRLIPGTRRIKRCTKEPAEQRANDNKQAVHKVKRESHAEIIDTPSKCTPNEHSGKLLRDLVKRQLHGPPAICQCVRKALWEISQCIF